MGLAKLYRENEDWLFEALRADLRGESIPKRPPIDLPSIDVETPEGSEAAAYIGVSVLSDKIAAGPPLAINDADISGHMAFSKRWLDRHGITRPLCVAVGRRERSMLGTINPGEIVLLDCAEERRLAPKTDRIYGVNFDGGSTLKRLIVVEHGLLLVADNPDKDEYPTRPLVLEEDQSLLDVIVGEVMWKGQPL
jgi:hypothetical protein